jgi:hypothetical protein
MLILLSCGSGKAFHTLEGSLSTVMDLGYDESEMTYSDTEFTISFKIRRGNRNMSCSMSSNCDTVASVTTRLEQVPYPDGGMDLLRGSKTWGLTEDLTMFPTIRIGEMHIGNVPRAGLTAAGNFHVTFTNGVEFASGKTLFTDRFDAKVQ